MFAGLDQRGEDRREPVALLSRNVHLAHGGSTQDENQGEIRHQRKFPGLQVSTIDKEP